MIKECMADPEKTQQLTCSFLDNVLKRSHSTELSTGEADEKVFMTEYLKICQVPVAKIPPLNMKNTGPKTLLGMKFFVTGKFGKLPKLEKNNITQTRLIKFIKDMGGEVLTDGVFYNICDSTTAADQLGHSYVTLQDDQLYKEYLNPNKTDHKAFTAATRCDFKFIRAQFILDCHTAGGLIDPETKESENNTYKYIFTFQENSFVKNNSSLVSKKVERQRMSNPENGAKLSLAKSRFKHNLKKARSIKDKYAKTNICKDKYAKIPKTQRRSRGTISSLRRSLSKCWSANQGAWHIYRHSYIRHIASFEENNGLPRQGLALQSSSLGFHWNSTSDAEKQEWVNIASVAMGLTTADGGEHERLQALGASLEFSKELIIFPEE